MQQANTTTSLQQEMIRQRLPFVILIMIMVCVGLLLRVVSFQFPQNPQVEREFAAQRAANAGSTERVKSPRGNIYDFSGNPLAVNTRQYRVYVSPNLISDPADSASRLAPILNLDELSLFNLLSNRESRYEFLGIVDPDTWREIADLNIYGIESDRLEKRTYPQSSLGGQIIGFVAGEDQGYEGVEGYYNQELAGITRDEEVSNIPFDLPPDFSALGSGADLVLTIDRDIQFWVETELELAINSTGSRAGTIIVMNPRTGHILAMASWPDYDPNFQFNYAEIDKRNPAIRDVYEPGSVFKVLTVAAALEAGVVTPDWTYNDQGLLEVGGRQIRNWDERAYGETTLEGVLVNSLNVGVATISTQLLREDFYTMMDRFGIGNPTRVDLQGEEAGIFRTTNSPEWSPSDLATNSFGQGLSVTPLQMLTAVNAIANDGLMMQPRIVHQIIDGDQIITSRPTILRRPISPETAHIVTQMMVATVQNGLDNQATVPGYTVAGKTGTAQIPDVVGYIPNQARMTFVGFLPADDPQISILVYLDRPTSGAFASQTAAPVFARVATRLVNMLEIPTDDVRRALEAEGVTISLGNGE
ncbi:MAG: penicillin-binding protein 2 [Anaerolineae bacterium]